MYYDGWYYNPFEGEDGEDIAIEDLVKFDESNVIEFFGVLKDDTLCDDCWMCNKIKVPAKWVVSWSDRIVHVCDAHVADAVRGYNGDHEYDKIDLTFY